MNNSRFIIISLLLIFLLPFAYGGCVFVFSSGGEGINRPEDDNQSSGPFIGNTAKATINSENAVQLTAGALAGGLRRHASRRSVWDEDAAHYQSDAFRILQFPLVLADSLRKIELSPALLFFSRSNLIIENGRFEGRCGGSFSYSLRLNRKAEIFSARLAFEKYCADGFSVSGISDVDGTFQTGSGNYMTATFDFANLSDGARSVDGKISMDFSDSPILATFSAYSTGEHDGQVHWIKDYSLNLSEWADDIEIEIFGTFYHPDHGYVTLTTFEPFIMHADDHWPASGQMVIYGDHNTSAQLMALDHLHYGIAADPGGDGIFDWDSGILNWDDASSD